MLPLTSVTIFVHLLQWATADDPKTPGPNHCKLDVQRHSRVERLVKSDRELWDANNKIHMFLSFLNAYGNETIRTVETNPKWKHCNREDYNITEFLVPGTNNKVHDCSILDGALLLPLNVEPWGFYDVKTSYNTSAEKLERTINWDPMTDWIDFFGEETVWRTGKKSVGEKDSPSYENPDVLPYCRVGNWEEAKKFGDGTYVEYQPQQGREYKHVYVRVLPIAHLAKILI